MIPLPRAFRRDAARIAKLTDFEPSPGAPGTLQLKRVARELRKFVTRWQHDPVCLAEGKALPLLQSQLLSMEKHLEQFYLASLRDLLRKWSHQFIQERLFQGQILSHQLIQLSPNEKFAEDIKNAYTDGKPETYDPESDYREGEKEADAADEAYRIEWVEFKASWPERIDAAFLARLENLTIEAHNAWVAELDSAAP